MNALDDESELELLKEQLKLFAPLTESETASLLARAATDRDAKNELLEHNLETVLEAAEERANELLDAAELFQDGSIAAAVAVKEYADRGGKPEGLTPYLRKVVDQHLDTVIAAEALAIEQAQTIVHDVQLFETAELRLRRELEREPTPLEVASLLEWTPEKVEVVSSMLFAARNIFDEEIALYLDDDAMPEADEG